jgi:hypothetical protein
VKRDADGPALMPQHELGEAFTGCVEPACAVQDLHVGRHAGVGFSGAHGWRKVSSHNYVTIRGVFTTPS